MIITGLMIIAIFILAFLVDVSINLRRVDGNIRKMIGKYESVHGEKKA